MRQTLLKPHGLNRQDLLAPLRPCRLIRRYKGLLGKCPGELGFCSLDIEWHPDQRPALLGLERSVLSPLSHDPLDIQFGIYDLVMVTFCLF